MVQILSQAVRFLQKYFASRFAFPLTLIAIAVIYSAVHVIQSTPSISYDLQRDHFYALEAWNPQGFTATIDQQRVCPITAYGASRINALATARAINRATFTCSSQGGGVVVIPPGTWPTGPFTLMSDVELRI